MAENTNIGVSAEGKVTSEKQKAFLLKVRKCFWVAIAILAILLVLSIVVLSIRVAEYAQADSRAVSLKSNMSDNIDVFSIVYKNSSGEITVQGANGDKVIAPGTDVSYTIRIRNTDQYALDYRLEPELTSNSEYELPIFVRILDPEDHYILGSAKEWATLDELNTVHHTGVIKKNEAVEYVFQWMWPYESGNDALDTALGNVEENIGVDVAFELSAVANTNIDVNGGLVSSGMAKNLALLIAAILLLVVMILLIVSIIKRRREEPAPAPMPSPAPVIVPIPEPEPEPIPEPEPEPVVVPKPLPKREGFVGKMTYINLDVIDDNFESGDVISLSILKKRGLIPEKTKQMKILARNGYTIQKAFIVETQGISSEARRIIIAKGGSVTITKG